MFEVKQRTELFSTPDSNIQMTGIDISIIKCLYLAINKYVCMQIKC